MTVNSPERLDFTYRLENCGSIDCATPVMLAMVAVGAIAMQLELRMPTVCTRLRSVFQSKRPDCEASCLRYWLPRASPSILTESIGRMPRSHSEPLNVV